MEELLIIREVLPKVKTAIDKVRNAAEAERVRRNAEALAAIDKTAAVEFRRLIGDSATADALDGFAADHARTIKPGTEIFPGAYRRNFLSGFLNQHPEARPYADQCGRAVQVYFDNLEQALQNNLDSGDTILLRNIVSIHGKLDAANAKLDEIRGGQDAANGKLDTLLDRIPPTPVPGLHTSNQLYIIQVQEQHIKNKK